MLGTLSRKLRAFGFDTIYYKYGDDREILALAQVEARVILTSDKALYELAVTRRVDALLVRGETDRQRIRSIIEGSRSAGILLTQGGPYCSICNGNLIKVSKAEASQFVPRSVAVRHRIFFRCERCAKFYWKGGHWKKLSDLVRVLRES